MERFPHTTPIRMQFLPLLVYDWVNYGFLWCHWEWEKSFIKTVGKVRSAMTFIWRVWQVARKIMAVGSTHDYSGEMYKLPTTSIIRCRMSPHLNCQCDHRSIDKLQPWESFKMLNNESGCWPWQFEYHSFLGSSFLPREAVIEAESEKTRFRLTHKTLPVMPRNPWSRAWQNTLRCLHHNATSMKQVGHACSIQRGQLQYSSTHIQSVRTKGQLKSKGTPNIKYAHCGKKNSNLIYRVSCITALSSFFLPITTLVPLQPNSRKQKNCWSKKTTGPLPQTSVRRSFRARAQVLG